MRIITLSIVTSCLVAFGLTGCGGSNNEGISNSASGGRGQGQFIGSTSLGESLGGPSGVVPPGTGQPTDFGPGGGGGVTPPPTPPPPTPPSGPSLFSDFLYIVNPPDAGRGNLAGLGVDSNGLLSNVFVDEGLSRPLVIERGIDGRFLYVIDASTRLLRTYAVNSSTGQLTTLGPDILISADTSNMAISPDGRVAYLANPTLGTTPASSGITIFQIGSDGRLTLVGPPLIVPRRYFELTFSPDGRYLYATGQTTNSLAQFAVDSTTGSLTLLQSYTSAGDRPFNITFDHSGTLAFVAYGSERYITRYSVDSSTGQLTVLGDTPTQNNSYRVVTHPTLPVFYVTEYLGGVETFAFTPAGDASLIGTPFQFPGLGGSLLFTPDASFVYFVNYFVDQIVAFSVGADGVLTQLRVYESSDLENVLDSPRGGVSVTAAKRELEEVEEE